MIKFILEEEEEEEEKKKKKKKKKKLAYLLLVKKTFVKNICKDCSNYGTFPYYIVYL